jgi:hypothetical protein
MSASLLLSGRYLAIATSLMGQNREYTPIRQQTARTRPWPCQIDCPGADIRRLRQAKSFDLTLQSELRRAPRNAEGLAAQSGERTREAGRPHRRPGSLPQVTRITCRL